MTSEKKLSARPQGELVAYVEWQLRALMSVIEADLVFTWEQTSRVVILEVVFVPRAEIQSEIGLVTLANCSDRVTKTASSLKFRERLNP